MKQIKHLVLLAAIATGFTACKSSVDDFDANAQLTADTIAIRKYVTDNKIPALKDKSGVFYQVITPGSGEVVTVSKTVTVDYSGKVLGASSNFDSDQAKPFPLSSLIVGWQIGIPYIQKGGQIRLFIPSGYAYGNNAQPGIPANSVLDFTIKLTNVQ
ncbi:FKBP-type peptidyl-prolyl cis-trans isomerase FkpA [Pedobacter sp. ok626]|uniref:FKBP-type peptidyl-prolyl cis-trans isomerase n=1 Tax=Pedobacter sp. ok626 TaxID=1761882 RepID=UPI00088C4A19|nr:FKBP-type peptidyl-prolyl cis-trans isomerase [Pedobacter sp. ok626]SDJ11654.1 FKBP-type peptidyl-prolyl cis-trans isomerase FkpA [Pedobacter sp. ok626]